MNLAKLKPQAIRSLLFVAGMIGIVEQEAARLLLHLDPSPVLVGVFAGWAGGATVATVLGGDRDRSGGG